MKRILLLTVLLFTSTVYAGDAEEIAALKLRVAKLERLVSYLIGRQSGQSMSTPAPNVIQKRQQYIVTLYDDSTFLIYTWDRRATTYVDSKGRKTVTRQYLMRDVYGKKRAWSCDKVKSILAVEK